MTRDLLIYLAQATGWSLAGFILGTGFGVKLGRQWQTEEEMTATDKRFSVTPDSQQHWNKVVGIILLAMGLFVAGQSFVVVRAEREQQLCFSHHEVRQTQRNIEVAEAQKKLLRSVNDARVSFGDPRARKFIKEYEDTLTEVNAERRRDIGRCQD